MFALGFRRHLLVIASFPCFFFSLQFLSLFFFSIFFLVFQLLLLTSVLNEFFYLFSRLLLLSSFSTSTSSFSLSLPPLLHLLSRSLLSPSSSFSLLSFLALHLSHLSLSLLLLLFYLLILPLLSHSPLFSSLSIPPSPPPPFLPRNIRTSLFCSTRSPDTACYFVSRSRVQINTIL